MSQETPATVPVIINKTLVNNAFIEIFSSLHCDDDDTRYELTIIEQYLSQQDEKIKELAAAKCTLTYKTNETVMAEKAMYLHYFTEEVIKQLPECTGDLCGVGEDTFIMDLYPFMEVLEEVVGLSIDNGNEFDGVFVYEAMEELAGLFIASMMRTNPLKTVMEFKMPDLDAFKIDMVRVVDSHMIQQ